MMNIKFQNIVVEIIIENHHKIFGEAPDLSVPLPQAPSSRSTPRRNKAICLSSGKRKARLIPPALCLADNDSDTFSSSPSTTPMGSQESLSSHSSEKNALSQISPPSSPAAEPGSSSTVPVSPPVASSCAPSHNSSNGKDQKHPTDSTASPHLTPSSSWTSSQLNAAQQTSSVSSSMSSLLSTERSLSVKGNSTASLSSVKESRSPSIASSSTASIQHSSVERASSLGEGRPVQRVSSVSSIKSTHSVDQRDASSASSAVKETRVTDSTSPSRQHRKPYRTASSSSSSSSSLFPYRLSTSSSLTSLHISEDYKSCHGSVQSLMSLDQQEATIKRKPAHVRCGSDLTLIRSAAVSSSNGYQKPASVLSVRLPQRESSVFSSALDICSGRDAKALYSCEAEHSHELSFPQGALFSNVYPSVEPGWLQATYNGRTGLIPDNYITYM